MEKFEDCSICVFSLQHDLLVHAVAAAVFLTQSSPVGEPQAARCFSVRRHEGADCPQGRMFKFDASLNARATRRRSPNRQLGDVDTYLRSCFLPANGAFCVRASTMAQEAVLLEAADRGQVHKCSMKIASLFRPECCSAGSRLPHRALPSCQCSLF